MSDEDFWHRFEEYEDVALDEYVSSLGGDVRDLVSELLVRRERLRDDAIKELKHDAKSLLRDLAANDREQLAEELRCFKDVLILQQRLVRENGRG